jgi:oxaloacetate decarboxylase gamma subunit
MQETLIDQGINLMLFGMGTVFVFLTILVFATGLMSSIVARFSNSDASNTPSPDAVNTPSSTHPSPQIMAAIRKAIAAHRQR